MSSLDIGTRVVTLHLAATTFSVNHRHLSARGYDKLGVVVGPYQGSKEAFWVQHGKGKDNRAVYLRCELDPIRPSIWEHLLEV